MLESFHFLVASWKQIDPTCSGRACVGHWVTLLCPPVRFMAQGHLDSSHTHFVMVDENWEGQRGGVMGALCDKLNPPTPETTT